MVEASVNIQQQGASIANDNTTVTFAGDREGALATGSIFSKYYQWLVAGQVFEAHFATEGGLATMERNDTVDLTEPFHRCTIPSSIVMVPIQFVIAPSTVQVTAGHVFMTTSDTDTFTSGGVAPDINNFAAVSSADTALGATALTSHLNGDTVLTETALTNPRQFGLKTWVTGDLFSGYEYNILKGDPITYIHGPASFQVQAITITDAEEVYYSFIWAELSNNTLVN